MTQAALAVLGPGGVGGLIAARTGAVCVGTDRTVAALRRSGLTLVHRGQRSVTRPEAVTRLDRPVGLLVVAVKAYDLEDALARVEPEAVAGAVVLPLLNGLEHLDRIRACDSLVRARTATVAAGAIGRVEVHAPEPGVVVLETPGAHVVAASDALGPGNLERALAPLVVRGLELDVRDGERSVLWEKAARLAALAAATAASGLTVGELRADATWRPRVREAVVEACAVAAADGVELDPAGQWAIIETLPHDLTTSTARDARAGRRTELDAIAGAVCRAGRRLAVPTPVLAGLLADARRAVLAE